MGECILACINDQCWKSTTDQPLIAKAVTFHLCDTARAFNSDLECRALCANGWRCSCFLHWRKLRWQRSPYYTTQAQYSLPQNHQLTDLLNQDHKCMHVLNTNTSSKIIHRAHLPARSLSPRALSRMDRVTRTLVSAPRSRPPRQRASAPIKQMR